jgi:hypothetical protein
MPTSRPYHLTWLCNKIIELQPQSILDIGVGFGSKGMLFREYTDVWSGNMFDRKVRIDGVEIFKEYVGDLQKEIYDNIYIGDIRTLINTIGDYDLIYMGDVIEHLEHEDGLELIEQLKRKCRDLIIVTLVKVSEQGSVYGNENETHLSQWFLLDFDDFSVIEINNSLVTHYRKPELYYCEGMKFYGERALRLFGFNRYSGKEGEAAVFLGLYFPEDYEVYKKHVGKKTVFWNGSDVYRLLITKKFQEILKEYPAKHVCHNELLRKELESVGIEAKVQPLFFADVDDYKVSFKPKKNLEVYVNAHPGREDEYGVPLVIQAAKRLPNVKFFIYGVDGVDKENVEYMGWLEEEEADKRMSKHHVCLRLNNHDGLSQLVIKAGLWGHYVITRQDIPETIQVKDVVSLIEEIRGLEGTTEPQGGLRNWLLKQNLNSLEWLQFRG